MLTEQYLLLLSQQNGIYSRESIMFKLYIFQLALQQNGIPSYFSTTVHQVLNAKCLGHWIGISGLNVGRPIKPDLTPSEIILRRNIKRTTATPPKIMMQCALRKELL
jgi:hypothetical protein